MPKPAECLFWNLRTYSGNDLLRNGVTCRDRTAVNESISERAHLWWISKAHKTCISPGLILWSNEYDKTSAFWQDPHVLQAAGVREESIPGVVRAISDLFGQKELEKMEKLHISATMLFNNGYQCKAGSLTALCTMTWLYNTEIALHLLVGKPVTPGAEDRTGTSNSGG